MNDFSNRRLCVYRSKAVMQSVISKEAFSYYLCHFQCKIVTKPIFFLYIYMTYIYFLQIEIIEYLKCLAFEIVCVTFFQSLIFLIFCFCFESGHFRIPVCLNQAYFIQANVNNLHLLAERVILIKYKYTFTNKK